MASPRGKGRRGPARTGTRTARTSRGATTPRSAWRWLRHAPVWIQTVAAVVPPVLALLAFIGITRLGGGPDPSLNVLGTQAADGALAVTGTYAGLEPASEMIVVLVREPGDDEVPWTAVEADREVARLADGSEDGTFVATIPRDMSDGYEVAAAVIPLRQGGGFDASALEELRASGPDASLVISRSETLRDP